MRRIWKTRLAVFAASLGLATMARAITTPTFNVETTWASLTEARFVVETGEHTQYLWSHSGGAAKQRSWLVIVDLNPARPLAERARVVGPLWDQALQPRRRNVQSAKNREMLPRGGVLIRFDAAGEILRVREDANPEVWPRERLHLGPRGWSWQADGTFEPFAVAWHPRSDRVMSLSQRYVLMQDQRGQVLLLDQMSGRPHAAPWLTAAYGDYLQSPVFGAVMRFSEELDHLMVMPRMPRNPMPPDSTSDGRTYARSDFTLHYVAPDPKPQLWPRRREFAGDGSYPEFAFHSIRIGGEWHALQSRPGFLRLLPFRDGPAKEIPVEAEATVLRHVPEKNTLVLWTREPSVVLFWNYATGTVAREPVPLKEWFELRWGQWKPKKAEPVRP